MTAVFVNGFDFGTTEDQVRHHFESAGRVSRVMFQGKGAALVSYNSEDDARRAVSTLAETTIDGNRRYVNVKMDEGGPSKGDRKGGKGDYYGDRKGGKGGGFGGPPGPQIIVRGFDFGTTEEQVWNHFDHCGEILELRFLSEAVREREDGGDGPSKGDRKGGKGDYGDRKGGKGGGFGGPPGPQVIVRGFDFGTTEEQVWNHFDHCGEILELRFLGEGTVVVKFASEAQASKAVDLNRSTIDGNQRYINVDFDGKGGGKGKGGKYGDGGYGGGKSGGKYGGRY
eukprot:CAMPEP_0204449430 /NCGR_PEP_ID=MMETSP0470-20130426/99835_1 /ASSEMBLY_ACC=CAM_ASM_000385 /TAXON_ID=2969 /ORGANISM="Oxyrrhis marina" /LENGTH=282 /DNA_ID=CAMNT_0051449247 /DNA_START=64 /DNA_END=913 /DNA_ORIENTATION=+